MSIFTAAIARKALCSSVDRGVDQRSGPNRKGRLSGKADLGGAVDESVNWINKNIRARCDTEQCGVGIDGALGQNGNDGLHPVQTSTGAQKRKRQRLPIPRRPRWQRSPIPRRVRPSRRRTPTTAKPKAKQAEHKKPKPVAADPQAPTADVTPGGSTAPLRLADATLPIIRRTTAGSLTTRTV